MGGVSMDHRYGESMNDVDKNFAFKIQKNKTKRLIPGLVLSSSLCLASSSLVSRLDAWVVARRHTHC